MEVLHPFGMESLLTQDKAGELRTVPPGIPFSPAAQEKHPADGFLGFQDTSSRSKVRLPY